MLSSTKSAHGSYLETFFVCFLKVTRLKVSTVVLNRSWTRPICNRYDEKIVKTVQRSGSMVVCHLPQELKVPCSNLGVTGVQEASWSNIDLELKNYASASLLKTCTQVRKHHFFNVDPPNEDIFLTTFYGLYFNQWCTYILQITFQLWASEGSFLVDSVHRASTLFL